MSKKFRSKTRTSNKLSRPVRWAMALALLPVLWGVVHQTALMVPHLLKEGIQGWGLYAAGMVLYVLIERFLAKPMWLYVFGHELTHAVTGVLSGAKVHAFKAKSTGGEVHLSKSNAAIALSPYIVPLYAIAVIAVYAVTKIWWNPPQLLPVFQVALGLSLAFHVSLTFSAIHRRQPDLKVLGLFLSGVLITLGNVLILAVLGIGLFSKTPSLSSYARRVGDDALVAWGHVIRLSSTGTNWAIQTVKSRPWTR